MLNPQRAAHLRLHSHCTVHDMGYWRVTAPRFLTSQWFPEVVGGSWPLGTCFLRDQAAFLAVPPPGVSTCSCVSSSQCWDQGLGVLRAALQKSPCKAQKEVWGISAQLIVPMEKKRG